MPRGKFESIYREIKRQIENMEYETGALLPSENQLTAEFGCSRNTVRRALAMLGTDGYVQSVHGKGVQVLYQPVSQTAFTVGGIETFAESAARNNLKVVTEVLQFAEIVVDEKVHRRTGFPMGEEVYYIQRVRVLDGRPMILDINMFLKTECPGITPEIAASSIYRYLEEDLEMQIVTSKRRITAERATPVDHKNLELNDYDFVAVITGQTYNAKGIMFEWTQSRHRPDHFCFYDTAVRKRTS